jgi:hypothetical protein
MTYRHIFRPKTDPSYSVLAQIPVYKLAQAVAQEARLAVTTAEVSVVATQHLNALPPATSAAGQIIMPVTAKLRR